MRAIKIEPGTRFNALTFICDSPNTDSAGRRMCFVRCICGKEFETRTSLLCKGQPKSCGCVKSESGLAYQPEYRIWHAMLQRCNNPNNSHYGNYGGRGIKVCDAWRDFRNFFSDMGVRPSSQHVLGRIDTNKGYEPSNCKWTTAKEQLVNKVRGRAERIKSRGTVMNKQKVKT